MPAEDVQFCPRDEILSFEEILRFVRVAARLGVNKLRLTGGEPLVRTKLSTLVRMLSELAGIDDLALTTNGVLLEGQAAALRQSGLNRLNISLDTLDRQKFHRITRRDLFDRVIQGIFAAKRAGFEKIKLNAIAVKGITEDEVVPLARFALEHDVEVRFIEFMPLDADSVWQADRVLPGHEIRRRIESVFGPLEPVPRDDPSQPAMDFRFAGGQGRIGLISPVSHPFCADCNRVRLTAEGCLRNCLFSTNEWDARPLLREGGTEDEIAQLIRDCVASKARAHGINTDDFTRPERAMFQIGG